MVLIAAIVGAVSLSSKSTTTTSRTSTVSVQIVGANTVLPIDSDRYANFSFTLPPRSGDANLTYNISGQFTATEGVTIYIMSPSEFSSYSTGASYTYYYTTGEVSSGSVNATMVSGSYYIVFANTNSASESSVTVFTAITASSDVAS